MKATTIEGYYKRKHPLFWRYYGMLARCYNPKNQDWKHYGGRGIKVVQEWRGKKGFETFVKDMGPCPEGYTLNRINNNRWYSPKNCEWASLHVQSINRRNSRNTSGYVGVSMHKANNRWMAYIDLERKEEGKKNRKYLGYFDNLADAIEARRAAEPVTNNQRST